KLLKNTKETLSIHGFSGDDPIVYIGGKDKEMSHSITKELRKKDFTVKESPNKIDAKSSDNIANKNESNSGVQLELTTALRKQFFKHYKLDRHTRSDSDKYTKDFYKFANAVQKGIEKVN
ncbi:poly-gamma-glutamate hydrolase family protein, partial [Staphylococcus epidermidis]